MGTKTKKTTTISTIIDASVKDAAAEFCRRRGLKLKRFIERALLEQLEDAIDLEACHARRNEKTVPFEEILSARKKRVA